MKIKGTCRKMAAMLLFITMLFQPLAMQGTVTADAIQNTIAAASEDANPVDGQDSEENVEDSTEDIEEDTTEDISETEERLYTVADYVNYAYTCPTLTAVETVEQAQINSDEKVVTGKILVLGDEGEALSEELSQKGTSTIYMGSQLPATIKMDYVDDISMLTEPITEYDLLVVEESAGDIGLTSQEFLSFAQLSNTTIIYDTALLYKYHTSNGDFHFDDNTGTLLINTTEAFAGTESYRSGGIKHERPLSIKGITASNVKEVKYLPTYPSESIELGYAEDSLKVNTKAEKIVLPDCITTLKSGFLEMTTLQDINLEHVVTIAAHTFQGCTSLEEADLSSARSIGEEAFKNDEKLEIKAFHPDTQLSRSSFENACIGSVRLPENLQSIPALCFQNSQITEVLLPEKLEMIETGAFYKTSCLTKITIPDSVVRIWPGAFRYSGLKYVDINASSEYTILQEQVFGDCKDLIHVNFRLKNKETIIQIAGAFANSAEEADYKVSCLLNNSKNQIFGGAYNNPEKDYLIYPGLESLIRYIGSITLDANEGSVADTAVVYGKVYGHLPIPTRQGYRFTGWYDGETRVQNGDDIPHDRGDITLTARWEKKAEGEILSDGGGEYKFSVNGSHPNVTSWETLSNTPVYYQNERLKTSFVTGDAYESQISSFSMEDKINAEKLFSQIYNTPSTFPEIVLNPAGITLNEKKYKKFKAIDTGLDTDAFIRAITLMNVMYFQNLNYMHKIKNDFLSTEDKLVNSYSDLMAGITPDNSRILWGIMDNKNYYEEYCVFDFEEQEVKDGKLHYEIDIDVFKQYYNRCKDIDRKLDDAAQAIGLNQNTDTITVADAVARINTYIYDNFAYDQFFKSWDLYWFFQPDNPQSPDIAQLLKYYHDNEGDNKRNHHGICQSYAFFACALFAKYGCVAPGYEDGEHTHIFNRLFINGEPLYVDYCWNADPRIYGPQDTKYIFMNINELNQLDNHKDSVINPLFQTIVDFNAQYTEVSLKKVTISKVKNKSGNKAVVKYKKVTNAEKYQIQYSQNKNFSEAKSARVKGNKVTIKNLKKGKTYYFRVRAYKSTTYMKSIKVYGKWSKIKKLKIRK